MSRTKGGTVTHRRHKKVLDAAKGYYGARSRNFRTATQAVDKANQYATVRRASANSALCGFSASMLPCAALTLI